MSDNEKTQPQELLEEVIGITHGDTPEFPTLAEQQEYWRMKDAEESDQTPFTCTHNNPDGTVCDRIFKSEQAVRMHVARVHTKTIVTPKKHPFKVPEGGVTKTFRPLKEGETMINAVTGRPVETLDTHRKKWSLARRRAFNRKKRRAEFGLPDSPIKWSPLPPPPQEEPVAMIKHCPFCGKGLERFLAQ